MSILLDDHESIARDPYAGTGPDGASALAGAALGLPALRRRASLAKAEPGRFAKRLLDLAVALPLLVLVLPLVLLLALAIACIDGRGPFYAQPRVGLNGRTIRVWKLRSMYRDADVRLERHLAEDPLARAEWLRCFKLTNDPRILPGLGQFIRRTSLDELPQLWNVLVGEMSLVGPRPFPRYHLAAFGEEFRALRESVTPGLTGLWQVSARSDGDLAVQEELDSRYVETWSLRLDLAILLRTVPAVLFARGAR
ncbi:sugar transferase [Aurantimonas sp. Leaf443]|uniref:sugar transferase n=1 Tax=Aurantimonas sp. Leaf443 TaxID=1736378 RepID=UPI0006FA74E9|nr:sugar transferase [Aurantimonas sp. Leaf443]KQT88365.1 hypothetical protein ASG48_02785 [Aurantimonas sp. Leaf443]